MAVLEGFEVHVYNPNPRSRSMAVLAGFEVHVYINGGSSVI